MPIAPAGPFSSPSKRLPEAPFSTRTKQLVSAAHKSPPHSLQHCGIQVGRLQTLTEPLQDTATDKLTRLWTPVTVSGTQAVSHCNGNFTHLTDGIFSFISQLILVSLETYHDTICLKNLCVYVYERVYLYVLCVWKPIEIRRGHWIPWTWNYRWVWPSRGYWESNHMLLYHLSPHSPFQYPLPALKNL